MGDQIEFPKNYGMYMQLAMSTLERGNYEEATEHLKKAYQLKDENSLNILLVSSLYHNGQVKEALDYALEKQSFYEKNEKRLLLFVELLIQTNQFLQARKYIDDYKNSAVKYADNWSRLSEELSDKQYEKEKERIEYEKTLVKDLYSLAAVSHEEQFKLVDEAAHLKTDNLEKAAASVFQNPYVHPLARSGYLSILVERQSDKEFAYNWFGESKTIIPAKCPRFDQNPVVVRAVQEIDQFCLQNPSLRELILNELMTVLMNLFPFISEVIREEEDIVDWIKVVAYKINGDSEILEGVAEKKTETISQWIEKVHQQLQ